jgi:pantothenate kinase
MDVTYYLQLRDYLISLLLTNEENNNNNNNRKQRYVIGLTGVPGAGKSTTVSKLVQLVNEAASDGRKRCQMLPMDGFHYYQSELQRFPDVKKAFDRRGAPYTFNSEKLYETLRLVRECAFREDVAVPSFDHSVGDPIEQDILIDKDCELVLVEGNYLALSDHVSTNGDDNVWNWKSCLSFFDELWFIELDVSEAMDRVFKRHLFTGRDTESAKLRIEQNDRPNAEYIIKKAQENPSLFSKIIHIPSAPKPPAFI